MMLEKRCMDVNALKRRRNNVFLMLCASWDIGPKNLLNFLSQRKRNGERGFAGKVWKLP